MPCGLATSGNQTYYKQYQCLIQAKHLQTTPQDMFCDNLLSIVDMWLGQKDKVMLMLDMNKHVLDGKLAKALKAWGLRPTMHSHNGGVGPKT